MSAEERTSRKKLVLEMEQKISEDPSKHYYIRGGKVCYRNRREETDSATSVGDEKKNSKTEEESNLETDMCDTLLLKVNDSVNEKITELEEEPKTESVENEKKEVVQEIESQSNVVMGRGRRMPERDRLDYIYNRSYPRRAQRFSSNLSSTINRSETPIRNRFHTLSRYS